MRRYDAIGALIGQLSGTERVVVANGAMSRETYSFSSRKKNFYLVGSMGLAASVGLGIALSEPNERIVVIDGDGNILMGLGNLAMIGAIKPKNLVHFILDNNAYATTGNQPSIASGLQLESMARSAGYASATRVKNSAELVHQFQQLQEVAGPHLILAEVNLETGPVCDRIPFSAEENKKRFMDG